MSTFKIFFTAITIILCTLLAGNNFMRDTIRHNNSITFIVGKDVNPNNPFYGMADSFFRNHPTYKTEYIVHSATSIEEIIKFLDDNPPHEKKHWENVNIVSHSSEYGLDMPLTKGGDRLTTKIWQEFNRKQHSGLPPYIRHLNKQSLITFWGCSFGRQKNQIQNLSKLFSSIDGPTKIRSPKERLHFHSNSDTNDIEHFYSREFSLYSQGNSPSPQELHEAYKYQFDHIDIDWVSALSNEFQGELDHPAYSSSDITIRFFLPIDILKSYRTLNRFIVNQPEIMSTLEERDISLNHVELTLTETKKENLMLLDIRTTKHSILTKIDTIDDSIMAYSQI